MGEFKVGTEFEILFVLAKSFPKRKRTVASFEDDHCRVLNLS